MSSFNPFLDGCLAAAPGPSGSLRTESKLSDSSNTKVYSVLEKSSFEVANPPPLTNDLTQSLDAGRDADAPFGMTLKRTIGSCFSGMMILGSELSLSKEEACNVLWSKYETFQPSATPTPVPAIATPFTSTDPCISSLVASLPPENARPEKPRGAKTGGKKNTKRRTGRGHRSKSVGCNIEAFKIDYSGIQDALEKVAAGGSKPKDTDSAEEKGNASARLPPLIRYLRGDNELGVIELAYRKLRAEFRKVCPDTPLYESDNETQDLTTLIMDKIYKEKSGCSIQELKDLVWKRGATLRTRHLVWPLILGYLPPDPSRWEETLSKKRAEYKELIRIWYKSTLDVIHKAEEYEKKTGKKMFMEDNLGLLRQIEVDINRTRPSGFLHMFTHKPILRLLSRLLITWSKAHPKVGYFQGLNELPTPLIVVFLMPRLKDWENTPANLNALTEQDFFEIEADTYWCLSAIMDQLMPYILSSKSNLHAELLTVQIENIIMWANRDLYECLKKHSIETSHYALRWSLCFMLREFPLRDSIIIWDSLISRGFSSFIQPLAANYILQFADMIMMMTIESLLIFFNSMPILWDEDGIKDFIADSKALQIAYHKYLKESVGSDGELLDSLDDSPGSKGEPTPLDKEFFDYYF